MLMLMTWEVRIGYGVGEYSGTRRKSSREIGKQRGEGRVKRERERVGNNGDMSRDAGSLLSHGGRV